MEYREACNSGVSEILGKSRWFTENLWKTQHIYGADYDAPALLLVEDMSNVMNHNYSY